MTRTTQLIALATLIGCIPPFEGGSSPTSEVDDLSDTTRSEETWEEDLEDTDALEDDEDVLEDTDTFEEDDDVLEDTDALPEDDEVDLEDVPGDTDDTLEDSPADTIDVEADSEPRQQYLFIPDSNYGPNSGFALYHSDAIADGIDDFDNIEFDADFGDSGAAALELEVTFNCDDGAQIQIIEVNTMSSVLTASCGNFQPAHGLLEDGGQYLAVVSIAEPGAVVDYELYMTISTVF